MAGKVRVLFFLEDIGHESLIPPLVDRIAEEERRLLIPTIRSARGGEPAARASLKDWIDDTRNGFIDTDIVVIAIDGNCLKPPQREKEICELLGAQKQIVPVILAIPNPHVECWYLFDAPALKQVAGLSRTPPAIPKRKCHPDFYKDHLRKATAEVMPTQGGTEFGPDLAREMNLPQMKEASGLGKFVTEVRSEIRKVVI